MNGINVVKTNMKDCDSFNIEVFNDGNLIATGSYNVRTNWAHIKSDFISFKKEIKIAKDSELAKAISKTFDGSILEGIKIK